MDLFESSEKRYADMNSGKLDAIVSTTVAEKEISKYLWNSILKIGYSPYYFGVSKKSPELYAELNNAITKILQSDWYYNEKVYLKYNGKNFSCGYAYSGDRDYPAKRSFSRIISFFTPYKYYDLPSSFSQGS